MTISRVISWNRRQCRDYMEQAIQWGLFTGFITGHTVARTKYHDLATPRRMFWSGLAYAPVWAFVLGVTTYFVCPLC